MIMAGFVTGSFALGGAVLVTVSGNQVKLAENGIASQDIIKDIQELKIQVSDFDDRIDSNDRRIFELSQRFDGLKLEREDTTHLPDSVPIGN